MWFHQKFHRVQNLQLHNLKIQVLFQAEKHLVRAQSLDQVFCKKESLLQLKLLACCQLQKVLLQNLLPFLLLEQR